MTKIGNAAADEAGSGYREETRTTILLCVHLLATGKKKTWGPTLKVRDNACRSGCHHLVHVGLWNDVDWMVIQRDFLTAVTKLISIICAEVSITPNVEPRTLCRFLTVQVLCHYLLQMLFLPDVHHH